MYILPTYAHLKNKQWDYVLLIIALTLHFIYIYIFKGNG